MRIRHAPSLVAPTVLAVVTIVLPLGVTATKHGFVEPARIIHELQGDEPGAFFGWAVAELTDIDADGVQDLIVSAPLHGPDGAGRTDVYSGNSGQLVHRFAEGPGELHGYAIADAGDIDADGRHDIVAGARDGNRAYVYSGRTGERLLALEGEAPGDLFGFAVASAGDIDGDGRADVLVGAPGNDANGRDAGRAYVFAGLDGHRIRSLDGKAPGDLFGSATDWLADVDADGRFEHVIGARNAGPFRDGAVHVFSGVTGAERFSVEADKKGEDLGWFFVAGLDDIDGDGVADIYAGDFSYSDAGDDRGAAYVYSGVDGRTLRTWFGSSARQGFGPGREAGDVDRDGTMDVVVGSYLSPDNARQAGKAEVFSGATGARLRTITSLSRGEQFGFDAIGLADVDGDARVDLVVSAAAGDVVYVIAGQD